MPETDQQLQELDRVIRELLRALSRHGLTSIGHRQQHGGEDHLPGTGGVSDHVLLTDLAFSASGHTGPLGLTQHGDVSGDALVKHAIAQISGFPAGQLGGAATSPDVRGVRETGGPTLLTLGAVTDGQFLKRSGATVIGAVSERALVLGIAGSVPIGPTTQFADFPMPMPHPGTLLRIKLAVKTAVTVVKTIQLRRSTDQGGTWADVAGFVASLDPAVNGGRTRQVAPASVAVLENDLFQLSTTDANAASGTNLAYEVVYQPS